MGENNKIAGLLPGFNCGACGFPTCKSFSVALAEKKAAVDNCSVLKQERFLGRRESLLKLIPQTSCSEKPEIKGLIDKAGADFLLHPLPGELSCRETLVCFASAPLKTDMLIRYRPLGCPITHFARIIEINNGLPDVWVVGPCKLLNRREKAVDVGICMVLSFQGNIEGTLPQVGQTVKFLPAHCMMGKVHSGIVVQLEGNKTRIDCIDLKIWEHAKTAG
jgi:uncharacterized Fe-S cluster-containing protein